MLHASVPVSRGQKTDRQLPHGVGPCSIPRHLLPLVYRDVSLFSFLFRGRTRAASPFLPVVEKRFTKKKTIYLGISIAQQSAQAVRMGTPPRNKCKLSYCARRPDRHSSSFRLLSATWRSNSATLSSLFCSSSAAFFSASIFLRAFSLSSWSGRRSAMSRAW